MYEPDLYDLINDSYEGEIISEDQFDTLMGELNLFWPNVKRAASALLFKIKLTLGIIK